jgi:hypothetical protein
MRKVFLLIPSVLLIFTCSLIAGDIVKVSPVKKIIKTFSSPTDYFRSFQTGDWGDVLTWQSSPDNGITPWVAATLTPTSAAATISIRNLHTVTVSSDQDMDEVSIESGGILFHSGGILTVQNGSGDDINIQGGGVFTLANSSGPSFASGATAFISPSGILRVSASGLTGAGAGVNASNFVYSNASVLEYTLTFTAFSTAGVTYFPNANAGTIPIFRITNNVGGVGGASNTVINGLFEVNGSVTFQNSGTKTFRNGIIGSGTISCDAASGKFIISGSTASLGGTGSLTLPTAGMDIGSSTTVTMTSNKSVTGNIALLTNALVMLGAYDLTMTGDISGGSTTSHIVTNGTGKLVLNNITVTQRIFFIGSNTTTINPLAISNGLGLNYGARVEIGVNPTIRFPIAAVNRTWTVKPSGTPGATVNVNFGYSNTDGNAMFNYAPSTVEQGFYTGVWNVVNSGLTQFGGPTTYQVTGSTNLFFANTDAPMVIANIPAILEPDNSVFLQAQKQNGKIMLNWSTANFSNSDRFIAERSADGRTYSTIGELPSSGVSFTDVQPQPGLNYYRIKMIEKDGKISYSNIVVVLNGAKGIALISVSPNPVVSGNFKLNISAAQKTSMEIIITDMQGRLLQKQTINTNAESNLITINVAKLAAGVYQLYGNSADGRSNILRFVKQ